MLKGYYTLSSFITVVFSFAATYCNNICSVFFFSNFSPPINQSIYLSSLITLITLIKYNHPNPFTAHSLNHSPTHQGSTVCVTTSVLHPALQAVGQVPCVVTVGVVGHPGTGPPGTSVVLTTTQSGVAQCIVSIGQKMGRVVVTVGQARQPDESVLVVVRVWQPFWQVVWQGRLEVTVGVVGQSLLGPGIVVVLASTVLVQSLG